jgi:hypothetical protein
MKPFIDFCGFKVVHNFSIYYGLPNTFPGLQVQAAPRPGSGSPSQVEDLLAEDVRKQDADRPDRKHRGRLRPARHRSRADPGAYTIVITNICKPTFVTFGRIGTRCQSEKSPFRAVKVYGQVFPLEFWTKFHPKTTKKENYMFILTKNLI